MLEVMSYTRIGAVSGTGPHDNIADNLSLAVVGIEPNGQSVGQGLFNNTQGLETIGPRWSDGQT